MVEDFGNFIVAIATHWVALMGGIISVSVAIWLRVKHKPEIGDRWFWALGAICIFIACFQAWQDQNNKAQKEATYVRLDWSVPRPTPSTPLFRTGAIPWFNLGLSNGDYLAEHVHTRAAVEIVDLSSPWDRTDVLAHPSTTIFENDAYRKFKNDLPKLPHGEYSLAPHEEKFFTAAGTHQLSESEVQGLQGGESGKAITKLAYVVGFFEWTDGSGTHEWQFCSFIVPGGGILADCGAHNGILNRPID